MDEETKGGEHVSENRFEKKPDTPFARWARENMPDAKTGSASSKAHAMRQLYAMGFSRRDCLEIVAQALEQRRRWAAEEGPEEWAESIRGFEEAEAELRGLPPDDDEQAQADEPEGGERT